LVYTKRVMERRRGERVLFLSGGQEA